MAAGAHAVSLGQRSCRALVLAHSASRPSVSFRQRFAQLTPEGLLGTKASPHAGHLTLVESIRRSSAGGMRSPHFGQIVSRHARTVSKSIFGLRGIQSLTEQSTSGGPSWEIASNLSGIGPRGLSMPLIAALWWMLRRSPRSSACGLPQARDFPREKGQPLRTVVETVVGQRL
jgi:hypothetical protein